MNKNTQYYEISILKNPAGKTWKQNLTYREAQKEVKRMRKEHPKWVCFIWKQF